MTDPAWWKPTRYAARRPNLMKRAAITRAVRDWFAAEGLVEVETPALQVSPGLEPHLDAFATLLKAPGCATGWRCGYTPPRNSR